MLRAPRLKDCERACTSCNRSLGQYSAQYIRHAYEFDNLAANDVLNQVHRLWVRVLNLAEYEHLADEGMQVSIRP